MNLGMHRPPYLYKGIIVAAAGVLWLLTLWLVDARHTTGQREVAIVVGSLAWLTVVLTLTLHDRHSATG
jgi:hypothetical protein